MCVYEAHSGQNHDNKIALQVSFSLALQQILWTCCLFLSSINNTFFSVLVIIFSNMSYFCFNYTNTFFIHTMNYFSVVLRIIFLMCIENYFFIGPRIIFRGIANSFLGLQCFVGVAVAVDWFEFLTLSIHPKILEILVGTSNGTDHFGLVRPGYSRPALKVVHFDRSGHFGRSDQNVSFHFSKLLTPVPHFCILLTRTSSFQCQVNCCE